MSGWFEYESGHAWCESAYKYQTHPYIAEFANTITNLPIIVLPLINVLLLRKYTNTVNASILIPNLLMTVNGIASTYYHATINLFGQLVDELSLVWIMNTFLIVYTPTCKWYPPSYRHTIPLFRSLVLVAALLISCLCFIHPELNSIALMFYSIPGVFIIRYEALHSGIPEISSFPSRIFSIWGTSVVLWISDRIFCDVWLFLGIPYLHALFHLTSSVAAYTTLLMFSVIDIEARNESHEYTAAIRYFPNKNGALWCLPYISIREKRSVE